MIEKVEKEYKKYSERTLSPVEKDYLAEIKSIEQIAKKGGRKDDKIDELLKNEKVEWKARGSIYNI